MAILAGEYATASRINEEIGVALSSSQNALGTTTSTTYTATLTGGTACGRSFTAPPSGKILVFNQSNMFNSGANHNFCTVQVRTGTTIGSGTIVHTAADADAIVANGTPADRHGAAVLISGLTAGSSYNVQQLFKVDAGTGSFSNKHLIVIPKL